MHSLGTPQGFKLLAGGKRSDTTGSQRVQSPSPRDGSSPPHIPPHLIHVLGVIHNTRKLKKLNQFFSRRPRSVVLLLVCDVIPDV